MGSTADRRKREREKREAADEELEKRARIEKEIEARTDREAEDRHATCQGGCGIYLFFPRSLGRFYDRGAPKAPNTILPVSCLYVQVI